MRRESHRKRRSVGGTRCRDEASEHVAMTDMHPIKVADAEPSARQLGSHRRCVVEDPHEPTGSGPCQEPASRPHESQSRMPVTSPAPRSSAITPQPPGRRSKR